MNRSCSFCHAPLKDEDLVTLNEFYIITHIGCPDSGLELIDVGKYGEVVKMYPIRTMGKFQPGGTGLLKKKAPFRRLLSFC